MKANSDIFQRVEEMMEEMKGSWKDFFNSEAFYKFLYKRLSLVVKGCYQSMIRDGAQIAPSLLETETKKMDLSLIYDAGHEVETACCISNEKQFHIIINGMSPLIQVGDSVEEKYELTLASGVHEVGHRLFTDFKVGRAQRLQMEAGKWFPYPPSKISTAEGIMLMQRLSDPDFCQDFSEILHKAISNPIEDGYIEYEISVRYPGKIAHLLKAHKPLALKLIPSVSDYYNLPDDQKEPLKLLLDTLLMYAKFNTIKWGEFTPAEASSKMPREVNVMFECMDYIDEAVVESDPLKRATLINEVVVLLSPFFIELYDKKNGKQKAQQIASSAMQNTGVQNTPADNNTNGISNPNLPQNVNLRPNADGSSQSGATGLPGKGAGGSGISENVQPGEVGNEDIKKMLENLAAEQVYKQLEKERAQRLQEAAEKRKEEFSAYGLKVPNVVRAECPTQENRDEYTQVANGADDGKAIAVAKNLGRLLLKKIKMEQNTGYVKAFSGKFSAKQYVQRTDMRYFKHKGVPVSAPNLAVFVLIDESGSVTAELTAAEKRAAVVMEAFCTEVDIPLSIYGYTTQNGTALYSYVEFEKIGHGDKYRLMNLRSLGGTPTVAAMVYARGLLRARPEEKKLLIVITDGEASDDDRDGTKTKRLIAEMQNKDHINTIAFGIGSEQTAVCKEFGKKRFVGIDSMENFPSRLVEAIRQNMVHGTL